MKADQVMVPFALHLIACGGAWMTNLPGDAEPDECFEYAIHRCAGYFRHSGAHRIENLVCSRMIRTRGQLLEDRPPLDGQRDRMLTADLFEPLYVGLSPRSHCLQHYCKWEKMSTALLTPRGSESAVTEPRP